MNYVLAVLAFSAGLATGGLVVWLFMRARTTQLLERVSARDSKIVDLDLQVRDRDKQIDPLREEVTVLKTVRSELQTTLEKERISAEEKLALLNEAKIKLSDTFDTLASKALNANNQSFLDLARQSLETRQAAINALVRPLEEQLRIHQQSESAQSETFGQVKQRLETLGQQTQSLSNETLQLRRVLSSNQARGRWGEETLRRVVEAAGMSKHCEFYEQAQEGDSKPDLIVKLPGDRIIIVDAKVPDLDFLNTLDAADGVRRAEVLIQHAGKLKATVKALADKDYPSRFPNALKYVVMFLPAESLFSAALEGDHDLIVWAADRRITLATPASLILLLHSVSISWQQFAQTENAQKIAEAAQELYSRVVKFFEHFSNIRKGLEGATAALDQAVGSYTRMVRPAGDRLVELGGAAGKELPEVKPLENTLGLPLS